MIQELPGAYAHATEKSVSLLGRALLEEVEEIGACLNVFSGLARLLRQGQLPCDTI